MRSARFWFRTHQSTLGEDAPETLETLTRLGITFRETGDDARADEIARQVEELQARRNRT